MKNCHRLPITVACSAFACAVFSSQTAQANPTIDPLEQLVHERTQNTIDATEQAALDFLIRQKTAQRAKEAIVPSIAPPSNTTKHHTSNPMATALKRPAESIAKHNPSLAKQITTATTQQTAPTTPTPTVRNRETDGLLSSAMGLLGVSYRFGGTSPRTGFDCSGFMQYIFQKAFAVTLPRTSAQQARIGSHVSRSDLQVGDMIFFRTVRGRISHVGMYVGNNRFIHAPRSGKRIEIANLSNKYWNARYATARRVKQQSSFIHS